MLQDMIRQMVEAEVSRVVREVLAEVLGTTVSEPADAPAGTAKGKAMNMAQPVTSPRHDFQPGARVLYHVNGRIGQRTIDAMRDNDRKVFQLVLRHKGGISASKIGEITGWGRKAENNIYTLRKMGAIVSKSAE